MGGRSTTAGSGVTGLLGGLAVLGVLVAAGVIANAMNQSTPGPGPGSTGAVATGHATLPVQTAAPATRQVTLPPATAAPEPTDNYIQFFATIAMPSETDFILYNPTSIQLSQRLGAIKRLNPGLNWQSHRLPYAGTEAIMGVYTPSVGFDEYVRTTCKIVIKQHGQVHEYPGVNRPEGGSLLCTTRQPAQAPPPQQ
jgi:hypothetical protein